MMAAMTTVGFYLQLVAFEKPEDIVHVGVLRVDGSAIAEGAAHLDLPDHRRIYWLSQSSLSRGLLTDEKTSV